MNLKAIIREFPDFPKPGILFRDISPVLKDPQALSHVVEALCDRFEGQEIDLVAGIESRGLAFAALMAAHLGKGTIMVRKKGKLPGPVEHVSYGLEYGTDALEIQKDAVHPGQKVLIVDDLLATGGTASAAAKLIEGQGGVVVGSAFVIELTALKGRQVLKDHPIEVLVSYD
jgi:adenine phosphoribosyltransferase